MSKQPRFNKEDVRKIVCKIPCGFVYTYGAISIDRVKNKKSSQAVAACIKTIGEEFGDEYANKLCEVPLHRVVDADGFVGGSGNALNMNKEALEYENFKICDGVRDGETMPKVANLKKYRWDGKKSCTKS